MKFQKYMLIQIWIQVMSLKKWKGKQMPKNEITTRVQEILDLVEREWSPSLWEKEAQLQMILGVGHGKIQVPVGNQAEICLEKVAWTKDKVVATGSDTGTWNNQAEVKSGSSSVVVSETLPAPLSTGIALSATISETDKMWHYQDPSGKVQGPFSVVQLRKWNTTGYFPIHLRIWRTTEKQDDSILLSDALIGKFHKEPPLWDNSFSQPQKVAGASDSRENNKKSEGIWNSNWKDASGPPGGNYDFAKSDGLAARSSGRTTPTTEAVTPKDGQTGSFSGGWDSSKVNSALSSQPQVHSPLPPSSFSGNRYRTPSHQGREGQGIEKWNSGQNCGTWISHRSPGFQSSSGHGHEKSNNRVPLDHSSGTSQQGISSNVWSTPSSIEAPKFSTKGWSSDQGSRNDSSRFPTTPEPSSASWTVPVQPANSGWGNTPIPGGIGAQNPHAAGSEPCKAASGWGEHHYISVAPLVGARGSNSEFASISKPSVNLEQDGRIDFSNPPTSTPKASSGDLKGNQNAENKWVATSIVPVQQTSSSWGITPNLVDGGTPQSLLTVKEHIELAAEWDGQSPTPAKPSSGNWNSVPPALKPTETIAAHDATPVSEIALLTHSSISPPASVKPDEGFSVCDIPTKYDNIESVSDLAPLTSVANGGGDSALGSHINYRSKLNGLSPIPDSGKGGILNCVDLQIPSLSTMTGESHGASQADVLDPQKKSGGHSPAGCEVGGEMGPNNVSADVPKVKVLIIDTQPDTSVLDSTGNLTNEVISLQMEFVDGSLVKLISQKWLVCIKYLGFESHGWEAAPTQKQEPLSPNPTLPHAAQKPSQPTYGNWADGGLSSVHKSAASSITGDKAENHPTQSFSILESVPSGNRVIPSSTKSSDWSISSTAAGPGAAMSNTQNNSLAHHPLKPPMSGNQLETGPNIQPSAQPLASWGTVTSENPSTPWRPALENSNSGWRPTQGNANMGRGGSGQGYTNMGWGASQGTPQGNANVGWVAPAGNPGVRGNQQKSNGERFSGQGERGFQGGDSGYGGGRPSWNRQPSFGGGGGGGPSRLPPKGQRVQIP
ncbi:hypothetical protein HHK36_003036 [Tetracentron sinense]|uniref:GYF domain-containing protein n=1 Tax=Tetracentron sinense TaxID=13715 RepID=A0A835DNY6_TETSI|nr:hypothetical protein HHK36_003036 [Tetracentron sinense]